MKKIQKVLSLLLIFLFTFVSTFVPNSRSIVMADNSVITSADTEVVLAGNFISKNGLGNDWDPANQGTIMKEYKNGLYEFAVNFNSANSDIEYKVALDGGWKKSFGDNGNNKKINLISPQKVYFRFDSNTQKVYDSINDPSQFKKTATLTGSLDANGNGGKNWAPDDKNFHMDYIGGGFFKKTFHMKAGSYEYKAAYDDKWSNGEISSNVKLTVKTDSDITFLSNPIQGICTDSISNPAIAGSISLIGTIRNNSDNWNEKAKGYEFSNVTGDGKFIYSGFFKAGTYSYKAVQDYSWASGGVPKSGNINITVPDGGKYVVFVCDAASGSLYDSINNLDKVAQALGFQPQNADVKSPVINPNGSITFNYKNPSAKSVYLAGTMTDWQNGKMQMTKTDDKNGIWSITLRLGDDAYDGSYKFIVDGNWVTDPANKNLDFTGNSVINTKAFSGRKVVLAGTIQSAAGETTWNPSSDKTAMHYDGNGNYSFTIKNVPAGSYEYKIAMGSWDPENYGAGGKSYGDNIQMTVPKTEDVTFWYNDDSHMCQNSVSYSKYEINLTGTGIPQGSKLLDEKLTGVYSLKVKLNKGTYNDIKAEFKGKQYQYSKINVTDVSRVITFSFDPVSEIAYTDASSSQVDLASLYYNSQDTKYKSVFGAIKTDSQVTFNIKTGKDITKAKLIVITPNEIKKIDMSNAGSFDGNADSEKWTVLYEQSYTGIDSYYFVVSNDSDVKAYGDDDGFMGPGIGGTLENVKYYDLNVYDKDFKTPDWMKNAVVYQIFPDRFFNGDTSNDYASKVSRGSTPYEFPSDWYSVPEDPALEFTKDKNGKTIPDPSYTGAKGDGIWNNDMYGGDLNGISKKLDYLKALGVNTLYINPISTSISTHRYDTTDYKHVDPFLGTDQEFADLAKQASKKGMHIILDGVFNHVSDDSVYFDRYGKYMSKNKPLGAYQYWSRVYDVMNTKGETQQDAEKEVSRYFASIGITDLHYKDWFDITNVKVPAADGDSEHYNYDCWDGYDSMATIKHLNGSEYNIQSWDNEIIDGANANSREWLRNGASGWRLDVANEIAGDVWPHFRKAVKEEGDNVIIGEIWDDASKYLLGNMFDSVMNYRFRDVALGFVENDKNASADGIQAMKQLELIREEYPKEAFDVMLNLVDSHDTQRVISALDGYKKSEHAVAKSPSKEAYAKDKLIPLIQMTYPGAPCIYYGDEAGMPGADDPDNRRGMIWGKGDKDTVLWYAKLANIRDSYPVLRTGDINPITVDDADKQDVMVFSRNDGENHALVLINRKTSDITGLEIDAGSVPDGTVFTNALNPGEKYTVSNGKIKANVPAQGGDILVSKYTPVTVNTDALKDAYDPSYIVPSKVRVTGITLDKINVSLNEGENIKLNAQIKPDNATLKDVIWTTSDPSIAAVDSNGNVTGKKEGKAVITAQTVDGGYKATCTVSVTKKNVSPTNPNNNNGNDGTGNNINSNGGNSNTNTQSSAGSGTKIVSKLPKTGYFIDTHILIAISILLIGIGIYLIASKKKKVE